MTDALFARKFDITNSARYNELLNQRDTSLSLSVYASAIFCVLCYNYYTY